MSQLKAGQVYQRVSLLAATMGLWTQPMSQIVQVPACKADVAKLIPTAGDVPLHPFRLGYATPEKRRTPRLPVREVLA
jgi:hypothetical protein